MAAGMAPAMPTNRVIDFNGPNARFVVACCLLPCATQLLHFAIIRKPMLAKSAPEGIRTPDPLVRSQMLYPTELRMHVTRDNQIQAFASRTLARSAATPFAFLEADMRTLSP